MTISAFIGYTILSVFLFGVLFFLTKELFRMKYSQENSVKIFYSIIFGGIIFGFGYWLDTAFAGTYSLLTITLIEVAFFGILIDYRLAVAAAPFIIGLPFAGSTAFSPTDLGFLFTTILTISAVVILSTTSQIKNNGIKILISISTLTLTMMVSNYLYYFFGNTFSLKNLWIMIGVTTAYYSITSFAQAFPIYIVQKFYSHNFSLNDKASRDEEGYVKESIHVKAMSLFISENKLSRAMFITSTYDEEGSSNFIDQLKIDFPEGEKYIVGPDTRLFILPINDINLSTSILGNDLVSRKDTDILKPIEDIYNELPEEESVIGVSLYGVQSVDIGELIQISKISSISKTKNSIKLFDYKRDREKLIKRSEIFILSNLAGNQSPELKTSSSTPYIKYFDFELASQTKTKELSGEQTSLLKRNFALKALKSIGDTEFKIEIPYPTKHLKSKTFLTKEFVNIASEYIDVDKLILGLTSDFSKTDLILFKNLKSLRRKGIEIAIIDSENLNKTKFNLVKPDYIKSIYSRTWNNPEDPAQVVFEELKLDATHVKLIG